MITKIKSVLELKQIFFETFFNNTNKVTKISRGSVLNALGFGVAKLGQKALKEIAIVESHLLPDEAFGEYLDGIAESRGIAPRYGASQSQTRVLVLGDPGTTYLAGVHTISGEGGIIFNIAKDLTLGEAGWGFVEVVSQLEGENTNVPAHSLFSINPIPAGHLRLTNEFMAYGGRDIEQDFYFKRRIKEGVNLVAQGTLAKIQSILQKENSNILFVDNLGRDKFRNIILGIATQNGALLDHSELERLKDLLVPNLPLVDLSYESFGDYGIVLSNYNYYELDMEFRASFFEGEDIYEVIKQIQIDLVKVFDFRYWDKERNTISWSDLYFAVQNTAGVKYVPEQSFTPNQDIFLEKNTLPKFKGFVVKNLEGSVIVTQSSTLPIYYPNI